MSYYDASQIVRTRSATPLTPEMSKILPYVSDKTISRHFSSIDRSADVGHARTYFNPASKSLYSRYSTNDWGSSNKMNFGLSDRERSYAERLRADASRAVKETDARTRNRQNEATRRLGDRVCDIAHWKSELNNEIDAMQHETEDLREHRIMLEKAYNDTSGPLHVAEECLLHREKRNGIDLVNDDVEKSLSKEVAVIRKCQGRMKNFLDKAYVQLKMNRAAQHSLDIDRKDKHHAQNLDDRMQQLRNSSAGIGYYPGIENVDNTITIPESWARYSHENIIRSQKERAASERLRGEIDSCLRACANEMWSTFNSVNNALNTRVRETTDARNKLQSHLQRTMQEIFDMERNVELLRKAILDKENPMKVAQTRLDERTRRMHVEICHDPVMRTLTREVHEIRDSVRMLQEKLKACELSLARLVKTRSMLQNDIAIKENSIKIDTSYCLGMRKAFPMDPKVGPIYQMPTC